MHVIPLFHFPYKIFYRVFEDKITVLHIVTNYVGHGRGNDNCPEFSGQLDTATLSLPL